MQDAAAKIHPIVLELLKIRGYKTAEMVQKFLQPSYGKDLHDPLLLADMQKATERIKTAVKNAQTIGIYGDYDIDGLTATTLLRDYFKNLGLRVLTYIPDRFEEGYGLSAEGFAKLKKRGASLVISVDCGTNSYEALEWAAGNQLDVIVTDHHEAAWQGRTSPPAVAIINPKRPEDGYPFKDLAGVGVAFKLVQALQKNLSKNTRLPEGQEKWLLDLVALGTVCDVVSLTDENRCLAHYGLKVLQKTPRIGLRELAKLAALELDKIEAYHLGFVIGPRLNAAGRLTNAKSSLKLLTTASAQKAGQHAQLLEELNQKRRQDQEVIFKEATAQAEKHVQDPVLVLAHPNWSHGIVGIVASKLLEKYQKPVLLLQILGKTAKGSARSFGEFDIVAALNSCDDILLKHGGHKVAAGCTLESKNINELRQRLNEFYKAQKLADQLKHLDVAHELEVADFAELNLNLAKELRLLAPFGRANPRPVFFSKNLKLNNFRPVGAEGKHLKLALGDAHGKVIDGIGFNLAEKHGGLTPQSKINVWYEIAENTFNGNTSLQLVVKKMEIL